MSEKISPNEFENDELLNYGLLFDELEMRRISLMNHGVLDSYGTAGSISVELSSTLFEEEDESLLKSIGYRPDVIEKSIVTFAFHDQEVDEAIYLPSELNDIHVYDITSEIITPCSTHMIPEQFHSKIQHELVTYLGGENLTELDGDERNFVYRVMEGADYCDQVLYQRATVSYAINPLKGDLDYSVSIDYVIAFEEDIWAVVDGSKYSSLDSTGRKEVIHHPQTDTHAYEERLHSDYPLVHESLSPGEHILVAESVNYMLDKETDGAGILAGISDDDHCKRLLMLLKQIPTY